MLALLVSLKTCHTWNQKEIKIYPFGKDGGKELSKKLDVPFIGAIPLLEDITVSSEGSNLFAFKESSEFQNILSIANEILKFQPKKKPIDLKIN